MILSLADRIGYELDEVMREFENEEGYVRPYKEDENGRFIGLVEEMTKVLKSHNTTFKYSINDSDCGDYASVSFAYVADGELCLYSFLID